MVELDTEGLDIKKESVVVQGDPNKGLDYFTITYADLQYSKDIESELLKIFQWLAILWGIFFLLAAIRFTGLLLLDLLGDFISLTS